VASATDGMSRLCNVDENFLTSVQPVGKGVSGLECRTRGW